MPIANDVAEKKRALDAARPVPTGSVRLLADWFERELTVGAMLVERVGLSRDDVLAVLQRGRPLRTLPATAQKLALNHLQALELQARLSYPQAGATSERTVCAFHNVLYQGVDEAPGKYREGAPDDDESGAPDPAKVRVSMSALSGWLRRSDGGVDSALEAHLRLMRIRPFNQGNAAVALLVTNTMLNRAGYPPIIIGEETVTEYEQAVLRAKTMDDRSSFKALAMDLLDRSLDLCLAGVTHSADMDADAMQPFA
jgi:Fic family protein